MAFELVHPKALDGNVFSMLDDRWMLVCAGDRTAHNMMTASWGAFGVLWGTPVAHCYIRDTRYTFRFTEAQPYFSLCFFPESFRSQLNLCGTKSGRDLDKTAACGFHTAFTEEGVPYFEEAELVFVCKKLYWHDIDPARFQDPDIERHYPKKDYHREYVGEIVKVMRKTEETT